MERLLSLSSLPLPDGDASTEVATMTTDGPHLIESHDGIFSLETLQFRFSSEGVQGDVDIYQRCTSLLDRYFNEEYGDDDHDAGDKWSFSWGAGTADGSVDLSKSAARPSTKPAWMS